MLVVRRAWGKATALALATAACTVGLITGSASPAQAANYYDSKDPLTTGCSDNATTLSSAPMKTSTGTRYGTIEIRYSYTCKTQWIRVHSTVLDCSGQPCRNDAWIRRPAGTDGGALTAKRSPYVDAGEPYQWSLMVYTPNTRSCGSGNIDTGNLYAHPDGVSGRQICG